MLNPMASQAEIDRQVAETISKSWWILLLSGVVSMVAGVVILTVDWTVEDLGLFVAILFIVSGVLQAFTLPLDGSPRSWNITVGIVEVLVGIAFVSWPHIGLYTVAIFIGSWIVVSGIVHIVGATAHRHDVSSWWLILVVGIIELALGIAVLRRPGLTLAIAITIAGIWAVISGIFQMIASVEVKHLPDLVDAESR
jgi:uncharacterized membrane protein HdeD (DUF308 family)